MIYYFGVGKGDFALSCPKRYAFYRTAAEWKIPSERPAAGGESCRTGFLFIIIYIKWRAEK